MKDQSTLAPGLVRLEKQVAQMGLASRRRAKQLILDGHVSVNGNMVYKTGFGVDPKLDRVALVGNIPYKDTVAIYKPRGIETSKTSPDNRDIHDEFPQFAHLAPIGRLDKDSEGLILLSNDGVLARKITGEHSDVEKEYVVAVREDVTDEALQKMAKGIVLDGKKTLPAKTKRINQKTFSVILREGRKHQIRRMCDACNLTVEKLLRVRVGDVELGDMKAGEFYTVNQNPTA
jgi:pseudouridine synthase